MKKVLVGMSGGLDSFVTALMLQRQGYDVVGVNLELWGKNEIREVQKICDDLSIPLISRNGKELFRRVVVETFVTGYLAATTPGPCSICNRRVKWELLRQVADELDIFYIATGHYVRIIPKDGKFYIHKGVDLQKDQSYFLWGVSQDILSRAVTPLGNYTKAEVRAWAIAHGYPEMERKKESMGVCFLKGTDYRDFIYQYIGQKQKPEPGYIVNRAGEIIGEHTGLLNYTIGQKRGMPVVKGETLYVAEMDAGRNVVIADRKSGLWTMELEVIHCDFVTLEDLSATDVKVKIRGLGWNPQGKVRIEKLSEKSLYVYLSDPAWAVAPGQPVAFYRGDRVIGGGIAK